MTKDLKNIYFFIYSYLPGISSGGPVISINKIINTVHNKCHLITLDRDVSNKKTYPSNKLLKNTSRKKYYYKKPGFDSFIFIVKTISSMESKSIIYMSSFFNASHTIFPLLIIKIFKFFRYKKDIKIIISPRNEFASEVLLFSNLKKKVFLLFFKLFLQNEIYYHATTPEEANDIKSILSIKNKFLYIAQNIDPLITPIKKLIFINKSENKTKLIFAGRIAKDKNIHLINHILKDMKESKNISVDLWGPIRDKYYFKKILNQSKKYNINLNYKGIFLPENKSIIYQKYHGFLFPALTENYGHVIADSLSFSIPTIISNNTPWLINGDFKENGLIAIDNRNLDKYRENIKYLHELDQESFYKLRIKTHNTYKKLVENSSSIKMTRKIFS